VAKTLLDMKRKSGNPDSTNVLSSDPKKVHTNAVKTVARMGLDRKDRLNILGQYILQFGVWRGQSFVWMLENGLGYASYIVDDLEKSKEVRNSSSLSSSKFLFKEYVMAFPEGKEAVEMKRMAREGTAKLAQSTPSMSKSSVSSLMVGRKLSPAALKKKVGVLISKTIRPNIPGEFDETKIKINISFNFQ
jgi:hypothetical protein